MAYLNRLNQAPGIILVHVRSFSSDKPSHVFLKGNWAAISFNEIFMKRQSRFDAREKLFLLNLILLLLKTFQFILWLSKTFAARLYFAVLTIWIILNSIDPFASYCTFSFWKIVNLPSLIFLRSMNLLHQSRCVRNL